MRALFYELGEFLEIVLFYVRQNLPVYTVGLIRFVTQIQDCCDGCGLRSCGHFYSPLCRYCTFTEFREI